MTETALFLYKNSEFIELTKFPNPSPNRGTLDINKINGIESILCTSMFNVIDIQYDIMPRASTINSCNVSYVTQKPYENLCWAATIACIVNYKTGSNYSAYDIAVATYGTSGYNITLPHDSATSELGRYGIYYTGDVVSAPSSLTISSSISYDNPVYGVFDVAGMSNDHICTIYGINMNTTNHRITLMDPNSGPVLAVADDFGYFSYISTFNNEYHELIGGYYKLSK